MLEWFLSRFPNLLDFKILDNKLIVNEKVKIYIPYLLFYNLFIKVEFKKLYDIHGLLFVRN